MRQKRRPAQALSNSVLKNKISKGLYLVGKNAIKEAFPQYFEDFSTLLVPNNFDSEKIKEIIDLCRSKGIPVEHSSDQIRFIERSLGVDTGGLIVILKRSIGRFYTLKELKEHLRELEECTIVALPEIDYEQNIGSMIRTSLALNADLMLVSNRQQKVFSPTVTKVSMGYNPVLPMVQENFLLAIEELKNIGFEIIGLDMEGENIPDMYYNPKTCFVMGNESTGISSATRQKCDRIASIPMNRAVESLNVSMSLGIILYDRMAKLRR